MRVDIWSDVVCPWCYVGKRRFETALARFEHRDEVEVVWHAFELDPSATPGTALDVHLAEKYRTSLEAARTMQDRMADAAAGEGVAMRFDLARTANTFDAHRVLHLARERGVQEAVAERLLRAYFSEGERVDDAATLVRLAAEAGLDAEEVRGLLADDGYADAVRADEAEAQALGITGVPFFVLDGRYGVSGAQSADLLLAGLRQAWSEHRGLVPVPTGGDDATGCADGSCEA